MAERLAARRADDARRAELRAQRDPAAYEKVQAYRSAMYSWKKSVDPRQHVLAQLSKARQRGIQYDDSEEALVVMTRLCSGPCRYCAYQPVLGVDPCCGMDRVDSDGFYTVDCSWGPMNLVGACYPCNMMKRDMTVAEFAAAAKAIDRARPDARIHALDIPQRLVDITSRASCGKDHDVVDKLFDQLDPTVRRRFRKELCYLCLQPHSAETPIGVDRMDSKLPYTKISNLHPCCKRCNFMKSDLPLSMFLANIHRIAEHAKVFNV